MGFPHYLLRHWGCRVGLNAVSSLPERGNHLQRNSWLAIVSIAPFHRLLLMRRRCCGHNVRPRGEERSDAASGGVTGRVLELREVASIKYPFPDQLRDCPFTRFGPQQLTHFSANTKVDVHLRRMNLARIDLTQVHHLKMGALCICKGHAAPY